MAGAGGAMRATGWRATTNRFQQFGEGGLVHHYRSPLARAREAAACSLSDISGWRDGVLYPWRVVAEESGLMRLYLPPITFESVDIEGTKK